MKKPRLPDRVATSLHAQCHEIFSSIAPSEKCSAGTHLFNQGSPPEHAYWIDQGVVKLISMNRSGVELIVALRPAGSILGAASVIVQQAYLVTAVTLTECHLIRVPAQQFLDSARTDPRSSWLLNQVQSRELNDQVTHIVGLGSLTARGRLVQFLLRYGPSVEPTHTGKPVRINLPLTQIELAQLLGITPEHLSRLFSRMEREGLIQRRKGWIVISDVERLADRDNFER